MYTDRHTDIQTYRASDKAGPRGAFAPKKLTLFLICLLRHRGGDGLI